MITVGEGCYICCLWPSDVLLCEGCDVERVGVSEGKLEERARRGGRAGIGKSRVGGESLGKGVWLSHKHFI